MNKYLRDSLLLLAVFLVAGVGAASAGSLTDARTSYAMEEGSGSTTADNGTLGATGSITGATWTTGIIGDYALDFGTTAQTRYVTNNEDYTFVQGTGVFTISTWWSPDEVNTDGIQTIASTNRGTGSVEGFALWYADRSAQSEENQINFYYSDTSSNLYVFESSTNVVDDTSKEYHIMVVGDGSNIKIYVDNVEVASDSVGTVGTSGSSETNLKIGARNTDNINPISGVLDQFIIYDFAVDSTQRSTLSTKSTADPYAPPSASNFTINAQDSYTGSSLSNFSAVINGTNYSTTNGTITTDILSNSTSLWDITVSSAEAGGYFNRTYTDYNVSSNLLAGLHQSRATFGFSSDYVDKVSGLKISPPYTVSTSSNGGSADVEITPSPSIILPKTMELTSGLFVFEATKPGYYPASSTKNLSALESWNAPSSFFEAYNHRANFTVNVGAGSADATNFTIDIYSDEFDFHEQLSTTTGSILANLSHGNYTVWLNDSQFELQNYSLFLNSSQNLTQVELQARTARSFNITFLNESSNTVLDNTTINLQFISEDQAFNASTSDGTYFVELLTPGEYEIIYQAAGSDDVVRSYFTTLTEQSFQELNLYLIDEDVSAFYVARAVDEGGNACQANTVRLLRYYVQPNEYRVVAMSRTDSQGQGVLRVRPNTVDYKLLFTGSCGSYETPPTKLIDASNTYTILTAQSVLESYQAILGVQTSLTFVNSTNSFSYTWSSESELVTEGCLNVVKRERGVRTQVFDQCSSGSTGSVIYSIPANETNETTYFAAGRLETSTSFSTYTTNTEEVSFVTGLFQLANIAPFIAFILFTAIILFFGINAPSLIVGSVAGLVLLSSFLLLSIPWAVLSSLIILGGVILYRLRTA